MTAIARRAIHLCRPSETVARWMATSSLREHHNSNEPAVVAEVTSSVGILRLNTPSILNSLTYESMRLIHEALLKWEKSDSGVRAIIIEGAGSKAFCAGGDVVSVIKDPSLARQTNFFRTEYIVNNMISRCSLPYISLWDGIVMGGGLGVSVHGAIRVATERTMVAMPETAIGLIPDVGGAFFLPRLRLKGLGMYIGLTGHRLKGADCWFAGIATHLCPSIRLGQLKEEIIDAVDDLDTSDRDRTMAIILDILRKFEHDFTKPDSISLTPYVQQMISHCFGPERTSLDAVMQILSDTPGAWPEQQRTTLQRMSPTALKLAHRHITLGAADSTLADTLVRDFRILSRTLMRRPDASGNPVPGSDFFTGVNAVLVEKSKERPKWCPSSIEDVTDEFVDSYFHPFSVADCDEYGRQLEELNLPP